MNAIVTPVQRAARLVETGGGRQMAESVLEASAKLQRPYAAVAEFKQAHPHWRPSAHDPNRKISVELLQRGRRSEVERLHAVLAQTAPAADIQALQADLRPFFEASPNPSQSRLLIGLMVDRYPQKPHAPESYVAGLRDLADGGGYTAPMVARACDVVAKTAKFLPAPAEFLEELERATWPGIAAKELERGLKLRMEAESVLAEAESLGFCI